jgi:hypothetical protein
MLQNQVAGICIIYLDECEVMCQYVTFGVLKKHSTTITKYIYHPFGGQFTKYKLW